MLRKWWLTLSLLIAAWITAVPAGPCLAGGDVILGVATTLGLVEGEESLKAVKLSVAEINAKGGIHVGAQRMSVRVEAVDLCDALPGMPVSEALSRFEKAIVERRIHAIIVGPFRSEVLLPAMDIIARHRVPMLGTIAMSPASEVKALKDPRYKYVFRVCLNSKYLVAYLIDAMKFLNERFGFNKVFIINQDVAWARTTASLMIKLFFDRAGWKVLGIENCPNGTSDFSKGLSLARDRGAHVILPIFDMPESSHLVRQWKGMKSPPLLCGFISPMVGPSAWKTSEGRIAGALIASFELGNVPSTRYPPSLAFYEAYREAYGVEIEAGHGPAPAYEATHILAEAVERAGSLDPDQVVVSLEKTDRMGAMGRVKFHKGHQVIFGKDPGAEALACLFQWTEEGRRRIVYPPLIAEGEIKLPVSSGRRRYGDSVTFCNAKDNGLK